LTGVNFLRSKGEKEKGTTKKGEGSGGKKKLNWKGDHGSPVIVRMQGGRGSGKMFQQNKKGVNRLRKKNPKERRYWKWKISKLQWNQKHGERG